MSERIGKYETLKIIKEFEGVLIELYGVNMRDAGITRFEALMAVDEYRDVRQAARNIGERRGFRA